MPDDKTTGTPRIHVAEAEQRRLEEYKVRFAYANGTAAVQQAVLAIPGIVGAWMGGLGVGLWQWADRIASIPAALSTVDDLIQGLFSIGTGSDSQSPFARFLTLFYEGEDAKAKANELAGRIKGWIGVAQGMIGLGGTVFSNPHQPSPYTNSRCPDLDVDSALGVRPRTLFPDMRHFVGPPRSGFSTGPDISVRSGSGGFIESKTPSGGIQPGGPVVIPQVEFDPAMSGSGRPPASGRPSAGTGGGGLPSNNSGASRGGGEQGPADSYGNLPKRPGINNDHQPSSKAWQIRAQRVKGSVPLTPAEIARIHNKAPAVPIKTPNHQSNSDSFGGRQHQKMPDGLPRKEADSYNPKESASRDGDSTGISPVEQARIQKMVEDFQKYIDSGGFLDANN